MGVSKNSIGDAISVTYEYEINESPYSIAPIAFLIPKIPRAFAIPNTKIGIGNPV